MKIHKIILIILNVILLISLSSTTIFKNKPELSINNTEPITESISSEILEEPALTPTVIDNEQNTIEIKDEMVENKPLEEIKEIPTVLGFYVKYSNTDTSSYDALMAYQSYITNISTVSLHINSSGNLIGEIPIEAIELAISQGVKPELTIQNQFSANVTHKALESEDKRNTTINEIISVALKNKYSGINIDYENINPLDRDNFTLFIHDLANGLHKYNLTLNVSVVAKTEDSPKSTWIGAYDYKALGESADKIQLMTYDEHGTWGVAGPVASYPWVESVIQYATSVIPSEKILLGLAAYGYDWNETESVKENHRALTYKNIVNFISRYNVKMFWDDTSKTPYYTYIGNAGQKHIVWYENPKSISLKTDLVNQYKLGGVAIWRMGQENEDIWKAIKETLQ